MARLRIVGYVIHAQVMADDGENLVPLSVQPVTVPAAEWPNVVQAMAGAMDQLRAQIEVPAPAEPDSA